MTLAKRITSFLSALAVCFAMVLGSLSFMPNSFALNVYSAGFEKPSNPSSPNWVSFVYTYNSVKYFGIGFSDDPLYFYQGRYIGNYTSGFRCLYGPLSSSSFPLYSSNYTNIQIFYDLEIFESFGDVSTYNGKTPPSCSVDFFRPPLSKSYFFNFQPFYFPQLPYGVFDGNVTVQDGHMELDLGTVTSNSNGSITYSNSGTASGTYSGSSAGGTLSGTYSGSGSESGTNQSGGSVYYNSGQLVSSPIFMSGDSYVYSIGPNYSDSLGNSANTTIHFDTSSVGSYHGTINESGKITLNSSSGSESGTVSIDSISESGSGSSSSSTQYKGKANLLYVPDRKETCRFRTFGMTAGAGYIYFTSDVRNKITASIESVSSSGCVVRVLSKGDDDIYYPAFCNSISPYGHNVKSLAQMANGFTVNVEFATLEEEDDHLKPSLDYYGMWFGDQFPTVSNLDSLPNDEDILVWANPIFGETATLVSFLDSLNSELKKVNSNLESLNQTVQSSISNQTNTLLNDVSDPADQPSTQEMMDYFGASSAFDAPDTSAMFSGDIKNGHYWDGVTWWSSKFNDIIVSNDTIVAFTTAMLTLGLAVLIIGRRFSMR